MRLAYRDEGRVSDSEGQLLRLHSVGMPVYDAILVLGGGVREGGDLPPWAQRRYDRALELESGEPVVCLSAGTTYRPPPLDKNGFPLFEAVAGARYLLSRGVPSDRLYIEGASWDTIGNAYFSKLLHVDPAGWRSLLIITSAFHMPRSRAVFEWVYRLDPDRSYHLEFAEASDQGLDPEITRARERKEAQGLETFLRLPDVIRSLPDLHRWLFTSHSAYAVSAECSRHRLADSFVLSTY
jgi:hypothetical protein